MHLNVNLMIYFLSAFIYLAKAQYNPLKDPSVCGRPTCEGGGKFKYLSSTEYAYKYNVHVSTSFAGTSKNESVLRVHGGFKLNFPTKCEGLLQFEGVRLAGADDKDLPKSRFFTEAVEKYSLRFAFHDGYINEVCPDENESSWVLNFKKGLLSAFQNTMLRFDMDHNVLESDVSGNCDTEYRLRGAKKTSLNIEKSRDLRTCTHRYTHHSILQTSQYASQYDARQNFQAWALLNSTSICKQSVDHNIYNSISCEERHIFRPFSNKEAGATTIAKQYITLIDETSKSHDLINDNAEPPAPIKRRSRLHFDHVPTSKPTHGELKTSRDFLKKLCQYGSDEIKREYTDAFTGFIHAAKGLSHTALSQVLARADGICPTGRTHMLEALPYLGSTASVELMKDEILMKDKISDEKAHDWMWSLAFIQRPSTDILEAVKPLLEHNGEDSIFILSISSLVNSFCKYTQDCMTHTTVKDLVKILENRVILYQDGLQERGKLEKMLISLKAIGNAGVITKDFGDRLLDIIENPEMMLVVRLAAVEAYRRLPCKESREYFVELFRNQLQSSELRIAAYLQVMRCPNYLVIHTIKNALEVEEVNQVGSFIWSHLHNLVRSANPAKVEAQGLLTDRILGQKFNSGIRKFSRNYEQSVFFEDYNVGGSLESNVIFSTESYIPRSVSLNFTVDVCGESVNLFELNTRLEGFEHYTESLFGPRGPLSADKVKENVKAQMDKIANIRFPRQAPAVTEETMKNNIAALPYKLNNNYNVPKLSLGMKIFGNDLKYLNFVGDVEVSEAATALNPMTYINKFLSGEEIKFKKAGVLLDAYYSVPTLTGFPLNLKVLGSSGVDVRMVGSLKADNFLENKKLDLKGNIIPSVTVDVVGTMEVDAFFASTGIKLKTNLYSSSAVEVLLLLEGARLASLELSLPKEKTEIFSARSELIVVENEVDKPETGYDNFVDGSSCSWPMLNKAIGLKFCANYTLPNVTKVATAPSFLLSGPVRFNLALYKADPTAKKYVFEYKWENMQNISYVSFVFNTPESEVKRLLGANITIAENSKNLTMVFHSAENIFRAHGVYRNSYNSMDSNISLDINGNKHLDAHFGWTMSNQTRGRIYIPKLYLAVNGERIAELSGILKVVSKSNISQYDINLRFDTKRLTTALVGYITNSDASTSAKLKLNYKFQESRPESLRIEGSLSNRSGPSRIDRRGEFKLQTTAYPQYNFVSAFSLQGVLGHIDCKIDINTSDDLTDPEHTMTIHTIVLLNHSFEANKYSAQMSVSKPITNLDIGFQIRYERAGFRHQGLLVVKYAPTKEVIADLDVSFTRSPFPQADGKFNLSIPSFMPFVVEGTMIEKTQKEFVLNVSGRWFSGHSLRARALYHDNSTASKTSHYLKVHMKSPNDVIEPNQPSHEIDINCRYHHDKKELRFDLQVSHNSDRYGILMKHVEPTPSSISSYVKFLYKTQVYSITSTVETEHPRQMLLEIHLDQIRDIHVALRGINGKIKKEFGVELKWDANRDPGQKVVLSIELVRPRTGSINGAFVLSYPGRSVTGSLGMDATVSAMLDYDYKLSSRVRWSPQDEVSVYAETGYGYNPAIHMKFIIDLYTPFEHWSKTALHLGLVLHHNLFHATGSVLWESNQQIAIDLFGDYEISAETFRCTYNSSLSSTISNVPSLSAFLKHRHNYTRMDTELAIKYHPGQLISIVSGWQLDQEALSDTLSGTMTVQSPFKGYERCLLVCRMMFAHNKTLQGAAELDLDGKQYTLLLKGHLQKLTNNMLNFNITTPIPKYNLLVGRFGFSEELRHAVAEVRGPTDSIGLELLLDIHTTADFDVKFHLATPFEQLKDAMLVGKLKKDAIDFRAGWNALTLGFAGVWRYNMITDMEYSYKFFIPIEHFEENGVVVKVVHNNGLDIELTIQLSDKKVGVKILGKPNPVPLYREFGFKRPLLFEPLKDDDEDEDDEEDSEEEGNADEEYMSWSGLLELDTIVYPTMKGNLDLEQIDTVYSVSGALSLHEGQIDLRDDFQMLDMFTMRNQLLITTPFTLSKEVTSNFEFRIMLGESYLLDLDMNVLNDTEKLQGRTLLNYTVTINDVDSTRTHHAEVLLRTPVSALSLLQARLALETQEGTHRVNVTARTATSEASFAGNLEMYKDYLEATGGMRLHSEHLNIPMVTFLVKKDFSEIERRLELGFNILENNTWKKFDIETAWHIESKKYINMKVALTTPLESVSNVGCTLLLSSTSSDTSVASASSASLELQYKEYEVVISAARRGQQVSFEFTSPLEEFRNMTFTGRLEQIDITAEAAISYELKGTLRNGPRAYNVTGDIIILDPYPLQINVVLTPTEGGPAVEPKTLRYVLARTPDHHAITARVDSGQRYLAISGQAAIRHTYDWDMDVHIDSSITILRNLNLHSELKSSDDDKVTFDMEIATPLKGLMRSNVSLDMTLVRENGSVRAAYGLDNSHGSVTCDWTLLLMKDMRVQARAEQHFRERASRSVTAAARYLNQATSGRRFDNLTVGAHLDIDSAWIVGTNVSLAIPSLQDLQLALSLRLPPPDPDLHYAFCKYKSKDKPKDVDLKLLYETENSERHYSANTKLVKMVSSNNDTDIEAALKAAWGTKQDKEIVDNWLHYVKKDKYHKEFEYNLTTPMYQNEQTIVASLSYDQDDYFRNASGLLRMPASRNLAGGHIAYHTLDNMRGGFNCSTPMSSLSWLGGRFKLISDEDGDNSHYLKILWPNNSALLDSHYIRHTSIQSCDINGTLLIELPLTTRHIMQSKYEYHVDPPLIRGLATLKYNNKTFLDGEYTCKSENRAGYDKDVTDISLDNRHTPVGVRYIHVQQYDLLRINDMKHFEIYQLKNRSGFNVTGELQMRATATGRRFELLALHSNRTVRLTTEHDIRDRELEHRSRLELAPDIWLAYHLRLMNFSMEEQDAQKFELGVSYPRRNISALGSYRLTDRFLQSEATLTWDRNVSERTMTAGLDWRNVPGDVDNQIAVLTFKHPSFEKDVTFRGEYKRYFERELLLGKMAVDYCNDPNSLLEMSCSIHDNSQNNKNYSYAILAVHKATQLDLAVRGSVDFRRGLYKTENYGQYKRSYLPLQKGDIQGMLDVPGMELNLQKTNMLATSRVWCHVAGEHPVYTLNGSVLASKDVDANGEFYLHTDDKLIRMEVNMTPDASQSMHMYGSIPDARSASFDIWRDYEDIRVSDVAFYLRLNHSRLVTSELTWRPRLKQDIKDFVRASAVYAYDSIAEGADYWRQYIRIETMDAINDIWQDAKPYVQGFLDDLSGLRVLEEDFEEFRNFLNESYYADDFYIKDIVGFCSYVIDELAIRSPIESLPDIVNEIWEIMGESGQALRKSILWLVETAKASYKKAVELLSKLLHGDSMSEVTAILEGVVERYDKFIKDLHVSFIKYMEHLWTMTNDYIEYHWKKTIQSLEPSFIKFVHYVETIVWKVSREVLDFLYMRTNEIVESPYFAKFSNFSQDLDHIYKDLTGNDIFSNIHKYSIIVWNFLSEKYFRLMPFSKELQDVAEEIVEEFQQLKELPSIKYLIEKIHEVEAKVRWFFDYFEVKAHLEHGFKLLRHKFMEITQTALQTENMYREAKTKFIFDPETGLMKLEQKLPMSWQAFNESPKFEEIPELKAITDLQAYFEASNTTFWKLYTEYKPYTEPNTWLPPFKSHALILGGAYFMTFDGRFVHHDGDCSYLLAHDFLDGNFSAVLGPPRGPEAARRISVLTADRLLNIDMATRNVHLAPNGVSDDRLPITLGEAQVYQDADILTVESGLGYMFECNLKYDVCIVKLSGWYFGKTAGLLGTMNNEPSDDLITAQRTKPTNLKDWAKSWSLDDQRCNTARSSLNDENKNEQTQSISPEILELCDGFFINKVSPFSICFGVVDPEPFHAVCTKQHPNQSGETTIRGFPKTAACSAALAYQQLCTLRHTPLRIPEICVQCELLNGTLLNEGTSVLFEAASAPRTTDVVFIVEAKSCNEDLLAKKSVNAIVQTLDNELQQLNITHNRYAVVIFGGTKPVSVPRSVVVNNEIFTKQLSLSMFLDSSMLGNKEKLMTGDQEGSKDIFEAIAFASKLVFRPGASKTFILLPCTTCNPRDMKLDYYAMKQLLSESSIKLHVLVDEEFTFDKVKANKIFYGLDHTAAYTKKDVNGLIGDKELRQLVRLPKTTLGYCARVALDTDGSLFTAKKLETDKRNPVKKFLSVFTKRVALSAVPPDCQVCECTARDHGTSYAHCYSCDYQSLANHDTGFMDESMRSILPDFNFDRDFEDNSSDLP